MAIQKIEIRPKGTGDYADVLYPRTSVDMVDGALANTDYVRTAGYGATTGSANAYTITLTPALSAYADGVAVSVKIHAANTGASTLNVNGLGAKSLLKASGSALAANDLLVGSIYTFRYNGTNFILQGEGGGGSNIKSIQRGSTTITAGSDFKDITIAAVNPDNSVITISTLYKAPLNQNAVAGQISSATTIRLNRSVTTGATQTIYWEVIEYNNVKSKQIGFGTSGAITISAVDVNKSILVMAGMTSTDTTASVALTELHAITSSTTITLSASIGGGSTPYSPNWQVIEFN